MLFLLRTIQVSLLHLRSLLVRLNSADTQAGERTPDTRAEDRTLRVGGQKDAFRAYTAHHHHQIYVRPQTLSE